MQDRWLEIGRSRIFADKSRGGLLSLFLQDYREDFKQTVYPSCQKCLSSYWLDYTNLKTNKMAEKIECDYELHAKYNGIQLGATGRPIRNGEMTNEIAKELLENHPRGAELFSKYPELNEEVGLDALTLSDLRDLYPDIKASSKGKFLKKISEQEDIIDSETFED